MAAMLLGTAAVAAVMAVSGRDQPEGVRMVRVARRNVAVTAALTGVVGYQEQFTLYAQTAGEVAEVYVSPGERVAQGQALLRLTQPGAERIAAAWAAQEQPPMSQADMQALLDTGVVRAPRNATLRQLLVTQYMPLTAGMPVAVLSSAEQVIRCMAAERDARDVRVGQDATLTVDGEPVGTAEVTQVGPVEAEESTGRLVCCITLVPKQRLDLPQGARVEADVLLAGAQDVPVLPVEAVTERGTLWWVHDGICTEIPAEIVLSDEMHAWVALPEGVAVAIGEFTEGQRVREALP